MDWNDWIELPPRGSGAFRAGSVNFLRVQEYGCEPETLAALRRIASRVSMPEPVLAAKHYQVVATAGRQDFGITWSNKKKEAEAAYRVLLQLLTNQDTDGVRRFLSVLREDGSVRWEDIKDFSQLTLAHSFRER